MSIINANKKYFIAYASQITLTSAFHQATFTDIEKAANTNNKKLGITGFLLFKQGKFFQYLEGDKLACLNLLRVLKADKRHSNLKIISEGDIEKTIFTNWFMCCFDMNNENHLLETEGMLADFQPSQWQSNDLVQVITLLTKRHATELSIPTHSYVNLMVTHFTNQHKAFLILQLVLLLLIGITIVSILLSHF